MKKRILVGVVLAVSGVAFAGSGTQWSYSGPQGPDHWGELNPEYSACSAGKNQSPINLAGFIEADLPPLEIRYQFDGAEILNNGHTIQVNFERGNSISVEGLEFELLQYHFHAPSENHIDGRSFPMEAHLVHSDKDGNLAVVAVMFVVGDANESLAQAWTEMPEKTGDKHGLSPGVPADGILPSNQDYYRFNGSLTTPPCSEGVRWFVMKTPVTVSKAQIEEFSRVMHHPNNRPIQPVNARPVMK